MMRCVTSPVRAFARYRSIENRPRWEKNASPLPSGLRAGATFRPGCLSPPTSRRPYVWGTCVTHDRLTVAAGEERPERLAVAVGEVARVVELPHAGELVVLGRVAQPHRRVRIYRADGEVLGHSFDEPEGEPRGARQPEVDTESLPRDVVLEGVHQLMADDVVGLCERASEGQHDPPLEDFRDAARSLTQVAGDGVGLLELGVAGVENEGLTAPQLVAQELGVAGVPALRHAARLVCRGALGGIEVDVEVL